MSLGWSPIGFCVSRSYFYYAREVHKQQVEDFAGVEPDPQGGRTDAFVGAAYLLCHELNFFPELLHVLVMLALLIHELGVLLVALDLNQLDLYRSPGHDAFALGQEFLPDDRLQ